ncbi:MAG: PIN domain-containing protein [Candidatus Promineifilaceae bacterium]|nr:PIN domain-containing protein [Candidatus Promineifilaceae bacterium]
MKRYVLDTSAVLTLRDDEAGAQIVADLLYQSAEGEVACIGSFVTQMEVLYRVWRDEGREAGWIAYEQIQSLPITWLMPDQPLIENAAELKATLSLSLVDAWIGATALLSEAVLVHKDPEFEALNCAQEILRKLESLRY